VQRFAQSKIHLPENLIQWEKSAIGFNITQVRLLTYASLFFAFSINGVAIYLLGFSYIDDLLELLRNTPFLIIVIAPISFNVLYLITHEVIHCISHPDKGLSKKTLVGFISGFPFVIYNGSITRKRFLAVLASPFIVLLIGYVIFFAIIRLLKISIPEIILLNILLVHLCACVGDAFLFLKVYKLQDVSELWNSYSSLWIKKL